MQKNVMLRWVYKMKKIGFIIISLFVCSLSNADTISVADFSANSTVSHLNSFKDTVVNEINGGIEGAGLQQATVNIKANSIAELDMADDANTRIFSNELLSIGSDTDSTSQNSFVDSGLTPADTANLISDISAGVAYINGFRCSKTATSNTYTASKDTYVYIDQNCSFQFQEVSNGASEPSAVANSAVLAKVVTDGTEITSVVDLAQRALPGIVVPDNHREGMVVTQASSTTMSVSPGSVEVNDSIVRKNSATTLTLTTAGNWAGGSSLQATSTYGYVGIDANGNIKMHTTAPTHQNYGVSITAGKKRYVTWSSVVYRVIGWFYMNSTGSGELFAFEVGNIREGDVDNSSINEQTSVTLDDTSYGTDLDATTVHFYSSGNMVRLDGHLTITTSGGSNDGNIRLNDGSALANTQVGANSLTASAGLGLDTYHYERYAQGTTTMKVQGIVTGNSHTVTSRLGVEEL